MSSHDDERKQEDTASPALAATATLSSPLAFGREDLLAGRYRIVRFIAEGGMGQVYEAEDLLLKERVALKTIHGHISKDARAVERFKREIQLARRVTCPNVCRIFDVGLHDAGQGKQVAFLSMELLSGETLADRIRTQGPLPLAEARTLVEQLVCALATAHKAGVVHRDFKSSNVILSREGSELRAVVTDFGLARPDAGSGQQAAAVTGTGDLVGSPHYMAPEQVEGGAITAAVDVYALGVVMYEMVTGELPFQADSALAVAIKRLKENPPPPRKHRADLDSRWDSAILRCLERAPAHRFSQAGDVLRVLDGKPVFRRRYLVGAAALVAAAALALTVWQMRGRTQAAPADPGVAGGAASTTQPARRSVAVVGFRNTGGRPDDAWLSGALAEMLAGELGAGEGLRAIPGESIARMKKDLQLSDADGYSAETLTRIRQNLSADYVVVGSYVVLDDRVRLDARLQDTRSGETLLHVAEAAPKSELLELVTRAGGKLRAPMGAAELSAAQRQEVRAIVPKTAEAQRAYSEGVARNQTGECKAAEEALRKAIELEPDFALAWSAISRSVHCLGREDEAVELAKKALDLSQGLPRRERLEIEANYAGTAKEWGRAAEAYGTLFEFFPEDTEYGVSVAQLQLRENKLEDAERTLAAVKRVPPPHGNSPAVLICEYELALAKRDNARAREVLARAAEEASARGEKAMLAMLRSFQGDQFLQDGDVARALSAYKEFHHVSVDLQDDDGVSWALLAEAGALAASGELAEARRVAEEGLALAEKIGSRRRVPQANFILFSVELEQGDLRAARARCATFGELANELAIPQLEVGMKGCYAATAILAGDLRGAEKLFVEVDALLVKVNLSRERVQLDRHRAYLMFERGDLSTANAILDREISTAISTTDRLDLQLISALVALDDGRPADAERIGREALGVLTRLKAARAELRMRSLLALALVRQDKRAMAAEVVAPVLAGYETLEGVRDRAFAAIALALTRRDPPSMELLRRAQAAAQKAGLPGTVLRTRLALAEAQGDPGQRAAVARDARARGYQGIARAASSPTSAVR